MSTECSRNASPAVGAKRGLAASALRHRSSSRDANRKASTRSLQPSIGSRLSFTASELNQKLDSSDEDSEDEEAEKKRLRRLRRTHTLSKDYTEDEERAVIKKLDRKLVLFLGFLYMLSFLDRSNIGNARIAGLEKALNMNDAQFDFCLLAFYITYITFEWMILLYRLVPPHIYISLCVFSWGVIASLQSVVTSFRQLLVLRSMLGITEAAFGPGVPFYMTFFYRRTELAYRVGLQISAAPLATSFASTLAWVIVNLSRNGPIESWRALFLFEGFPSIITAVFAWYFIPDSPETARYLNPRERKVAKLRLQSDVQTPADHSGQVSHQTSSSHPKSSRLNFQDLLSTLTDPKAYLTSLMFFSVNVSFASLPVFLPTIIKSMSFTPLASQILSAPPYLLSFVFVLLIGHHSDKRADSRSTFLAGCAVLSSISYGLIALAGAFHDDIGEVGSITLRYVATFGAAMGLFSSVVLIITWSLNNQRSETGKGTGLMILNVIGQCGPLVGVKLFPDSDGPFYIKGMIVCAGFMLGVAVLAGILRIWLGRLNSHLEGDEKDTGRGTYEMVGLTNHEDNEGADIEHTKISDNGDTEEPEEVAGLISEQINVVAARDTFRYML